MCICRKKRMCDCCPMTELYAKAARERDTAVKLCREMAEERRKAEDELEQERRATERMWSEFEKRLNTPATGKVAGV